MRLGEFIKRGGKSTNRDNPQPSPPCSLITVRALLQTCAPDIPALGDNPVGESNAAPSVLLLTHFDALYIRPVRKRRPQGYNPA